MNHTFIQCTFGILLEYVLEYLWNLLLLICGEVEEVLRVQISFSIRVRNKNTQHYYNKN